MVCGVVGRTCQIAACTLDGVLPTPLEGGTLSGIGIWTLSVGLGNYASDRASPVDFVRALPRD